VSGRADESDRHGLQAALELAQAGKVKKVLVHEVSRLARRNSIVHRFVESLEEVGVSLYWHQQGVETLLASGKRNPAASVMLALPSGSASIADWPKHGGRGASLAVQRAPGWMRPTC
jgi:DNA invertase Pin-like site-specific DNA recombinase